jgi:hypothetical protein
VRPRPELWVGTYIANEPVWDWLNYGRVGLDPATRLGHAVHFFYDVAKIMLLVTGLIFLIGMVRTAISPERVWPYVLVGIGIGAAIHGWLPEDFFAAYAGPDNPLAVPIVTLVGAPCTPTSPASPPLVQALSAKGMAAAARPQTSPAQPLHRRRRHPRRRFLLNLVFSAIL